MLSKLQILTKARNIIAKAENWCTGSFYEEYDNGTVAYCARGAILKTLIDHNIYNKQEIYEYECCEELLSDISEDQIAQISMIMPHATHKIAMFNNNKTHSEVIDLFNRTISRLKRQKIIDKLKNTSPNVKRKETV